MAGIDRRSFVAGLGALLGTTALVKPALPVAETMTSTIMAGDVSYVAASELWADVLQQEWNALMSVQLDAININWQAVHGHMIEIQGFRIIIDHGAEPWLSETPNPVDN